MHVTELRPSVARSFQPILQLSNAGFPAPPVAAFLSTEASPATANSDVAAIALPTTIDQLDRLPWTNELLTSAFGVAGPSTRQLKGASLMAEVIKQGYPAFKPAANAIAIVVATKELADALADEDAGRMDQLLKTGKLLVATGNLATDFGDTIPGLNQAAPYLQTLGIIVKVSEAVTLVFTSDDKSAGSRGLKAIQSTAAGPPGLTR